MQNKIMITNSIEGLREFYLQNLGAKTYVASDSDDYKNQGLPNELFLFLRDFEINTINLFIFGNDICLPSLKDIYDHQLGYSYNSIKKARIASWPDNYWVVASCGADPFVFNANNGTISFGAHGKGNWNFVECHKTIIDFYWFAGVISLIARKNRDKWTDGFLELYAEAEEFLSPYYSPKEIKMGLRAFSLK